MPLPPYFSSTMMPINPNSAISLTYSVGYSPLLSLSIMPGFNCRWAKSAAVCRMTLCSSVSVKSIFKCIIFLEAAKTYVQDV